MRAIVTDFEVASEATMSYPKPYAKGTLVYVRVNFTQNGNSADPDVVHLRFRSPRQARTLWIYGIDAAIVKDSTGVYHADLDTTPAAGTWRYHWEGNGAVVSRKFTVA